jgi:hypothetical protein
MTTETLRQRHQPKGGLPAMDWATLAERPAAEREEQLHRFYTALAALPESERLTHLRSMTTATYALPDDGFRALTASRLRAWLRLDDADASCVARSYDTVMREASANDAMRRVAVVQTLMRDFSEDEQRRLRQLNPEERARGLVLTSLGSTET